jgi:hypothetical protein
MSMNRIPPNDTRRTLDSQPVPPRPGPELFILRLKGGELKTITIYSRSLFGVNVHWNGAKSEPHFKEEKNCNGCLKKMPMRWKGFLHGFCHEMGQEVFLELTPASAHSLLDQLGQGTVMRGNRIQVKRTKGDKGRLIIACLTAVPNPESLPPEKDPATSLLRLWGFQDLVSKPAEPVADLRHLVNGLAKHSECL